MFTNNFDMQKHIHLKTIQCHFNENVVSVAGVSKMTISSLIIMFAEHFEVRFFTVFINTFET